MCAEAPDRRPLRDCRDVEVLMGCHPPPWFQGTTGHWHALSPGARLNLAFAQVHRQGRIASKEWWENREFFARVHPWAQVGFGCRPVELLVDAGGGHGLQALLWLALGAARSALVVDRRRPRIYPELVNALQQVIPFCAPQYVEARWQEFDPPALPTDTLIVGVHACGRFGEQLMEWARRRKRPFAVLTCCHDTREEAFAARLKALAHQKQVSYFDALDLVRLGRIQGWGWKARMETISPSVSPRNNILIGFPPP